MKKTAIALAAIAAVGMGTASAQDYQMEAGVGYTHISPDVGSSDNAFDVDFTYYLDRVATANKPLAEAAFLSQASGITVGYANVDKADVDTIGISGEFYFDQLYIAAGYAAADFSGIDVDTLSARVGWMLQDGLRVAAGIDRVDVDVPGSSASNDIVLEGKYVADLGGGTAFNAEATITFLDEADDTVFAIGGDYYLNPALSFGAGLSFADDKKSDGTNWNLRARYFVTPVISVQAEYFTANDGDDDAFRLSAALRF